MVEGPIGDVFENAHMLFVEDLCDGISQGGAVQETCVVCPAGCQNFSRSIDDGFHAVGARALILCLDVEHQTVVFDVCVISGHCLNFILRTSLMARCPAFLAFSLFSNSSS